jgi:hypothetical protein
VPFKYLDQFVNADLVYLIELGLTQNLITSFIGLSKAGLGDVP